MKDIRVNINAMVSYRLTDHGKQVLHDHIRQSESLLREYLVARGRSSVAERTAGMDSSHKRYLTRMQLWQFMQIFGEHLSLGAAPVLVNGTLSFDDTDE